MRPSLPYLRRRIAHHRKLSALIFIFLISTLEVLHHVSTYRVHRPTTPQDAPFHTSCQDPSITSSLPRENAAILMLARNNDKDGAVKSLRSLEDNFNKWFHYPVIFLNDKDWDRGFTDAVSTVVSGNVTFDVIPKHMWSFPSWMDKEAARQSIAQQGGRGIWRGGYESYHHMCRFFSGQFYDHEALRPYKWYWRVEPDVEFTCAITYDPFVEMAKAGKRYGWAMALWELGDTSPSLFRTVSDYKGRLRLPSTTLWKSMVDTSWAPWPLRRWLIGSASGRSRDGDAWSFCHYWSNFEIADLEFFRSAEYRRFFRMLDEAGGFYFERWGDAPVHSFAAALFLEPRQVHHFEDFGYVHEPYSVCPVNAVGGQLPGSVALGQGAWSQDGLGGIGCRCKCDADEASKSHPGTCRAKLKQSLS